MRMFVLSAPITSTVQREREREARSREKEREAEGERDPRRPLLLPEAFPSLRAAHSLAAHLKPSFKPGQWGVRVLSQIAGVGGGSYQEAAFTQPL